MANPYLATGARRAPIVAADPAMAGSNPGVIQYLQDIFTGGKKAAGSAASAVPDAIDKGKAGALGYLRGKAVPLAGAGGILSVLAAAGELTDEDDPFARNASQAVGNLAGGWGGAAAGAAAGAALGSVVPIIGTGIGGIAGGILGGIGGTAAGSAVGGSVYDAVMDESPEDRAAAQKVRDANMNNKLLLAQAATQRQIKVDDMQANMPFMKDAMAIKRQDDMLRAERQLRVNNDYNYANALNQAMVNAQQQAATQELALTQYMMG